MEKLLSVAVLSEKMGRNGFHYAISKEDISTRRKFCSTVSNKIFFFIKISLPLERMFFPLLERNKR